MRLVATLTTIPARLPDIKPVLRSLAKQRLKFDCIYLNIPKKSLKGQEYVIPENLLANIPHGLVKIVRCEKDYGPITKLIPVLEIETDPDTCIVVFDDDQLVDRNVSKILVEKSNEYPDCALSFSGWCVGTFPLLFQYFLTNTRDIEVDWIQGSHAILIKRKFLSLDRMLDLTGFDEKLFSKNDDHWISYNLHLNNVKRIKIGRNALEYFKPYLCHVDAISGRMLVFYIEVMKISFMMKKLGVYYRSSGFESLTLDSPSLWVITSLVVLLICGVIIYINKKVKSINGERFQRIM